MRSVNRWWIAVAGVCLQMALGAAYAWSVFRIPLVKEYGWSIAEVSFTFAIAWFFLGLNSFLGGLWLAGEVVSRGPHVVRSFRRLAPAIGRSWSGD